MKKTKAKTKKPKKPTTIDAVMEIEIKGCGGPGVALGDILIVEVPLYLSALSHRTRYSKKPTGIIEQIAIETTIEKISIKPLNVAEIKRAIKAFDKE